MSITVCHFALTINYQLIVKKYSSQYDATNKEIELKLMSIITRNFVKSNKNECPKFKMSHQPLLLEHDVRPKICLLFHSGQANKET